MSGSTFQKGLFNGKTALVTGAAGGIGAGIAGAFADLGAHVVMQDIDGDALARLAGTLRGRGGAVTTLTGDLSVRGTAGRIFDGALAAQGQVDILVNNAGRSWGVTTEDITWDRTDELTELNLNSVLALSRCFVAHARQRGGGGSVIQISSTAGITGFQRRAVYCATKFGVIGLTRVLAIDHARDNIRVNAILPHVVDTEMFRTVALPEDAASWRAGIPMGRFAEVEDVANLAVFLCSPAASYLTGGLYPVDGGAMAGSFQEGP